MTQVSVTSVQNFLLTQNGSVEKYLDSLPAAHVLLEGGRCWYVLSTQERIWNFVVDGPKHLERRQTDTFLTTSQVSVACDFRHEEVHPLL